MQSPKPNQTLVQIFQSEQNTMTLADCKKLYLATMDDLETGFRRYEAIRKLHAHAFAALYEANIRGRNFDQMIDRIVAGETWEEVTK